MVSEGMYYRMMGNTGLQVSVLSYGFWATYGVKDRLMENEGIEMAKKCMSIARADDLPRLTVQVTRRIRLLIPGQIGQRATPSRTLRGSTNSFQATLSPVLRRATAWLGGGISPTIHDYSSVASCCLYNGLAVSRSTPR